MTSSLGCCLSRATILRASSNGQAFECSAISRIPAAWASMVDINISVPLRGAKSKRADGKIAQPQIGETSLLPYPEQRPVQSKPDRIIALAHGDADTLA